MVRSGWVSLWFRGETHRSLSISQAHRKLLLDRFCQQAAQCSRRVGWRNRMAQAASTVEKQPSSSSPAGLLKLGLQGRKQALKQALQALLMRNRGHHASPAPASNGGGTHLQASSQSREASSFPLQCILHQISDLLSLNLGIGGVIDPIPVHLGRDGFPAAVRHQTHQCAVVARYRRQQRASSESARRDEPDLRRTGFGSRVWAVERSSFDERMKNSGRGPARDLMDRGGHAGDSAVGRQPGGEVGWALEVEQGIGQRFELLQRQRLDLGGGGF